MLNYVPIVRHVRIKAEANPFDPRWELYFERRDQRRAGNSGYPVVSVPAGYAEWARDYEATVATGLDRPLLEALTSIDWEAIATAADLACGTGRTGFLAQVICSRDPTRGAK